MDKYGVYTGNSEGFGSLTEGYIDYSKELIVNRSFPEVRDGLKPVGRRILYATNNLKREGLIKSGTLVGRIMEIHPHGDSSIYEAMMNMTDRNGSYNVPYFVGQGGCGRVVSSAPPAAMRYTKARLNDNALDFFRDMEACEFKPAEEGEGVEPVVLPVRYPVVLVNGTNGMAVSVSTNIPHFNFHDVIDLTIKHIENGGLYLDDVIVPDFPTGGVLVKNDSELTKIMLTGNGTFKIRAKVEIVGKSILVKELPYGRTIENIINSINNGEIPGVKTAMAMSGQNAPALVEIECKTKNVVEQVLLDLYRRRILQNTFSSNIIVVNDDKPLICGVHKVIEEWVNWRRKVCKVKLQKNLEGVEEELVQLDYFVRLIMNEEWKNTYVAKATREGKKNAKAYLKEIFLDIPDDVCSWINERSLSAFHNGGRYATRYNDLMEVKSNLIKYLADVDSYIVDDLRALKSEKAGRFARKTFVTNQDYKFSKVSNDEIIDDSYCVYTLMKDGFLMKTRDIIEGEDVVCSIEAKANSTLIGFDNFGRVLRVFGEEIEFTGMGENGDYMPKYFEATFQQDYKVMYLGLLDGKKRMLIYKDGYVGFFDTSEWVGKKRVKIVNRGVDLSVFDRLVEVVEEENIPEYLVVADDHGKKVRFGVAQVSAIGEKSRKSRTKVFSGSNVNINYWAGMDYMQLLSFMKDPQYYLNKLKPHKDIIGDVAVMKEGRYYIEGSLLEEED